ncbi:hypothetical protein CEXT_742891 [Caerostris extrusa]|uniref:Uncharacterized protein n=1 Tax=Caerostris extrusa TaxID=172846 RepID=A0AAV4VIW5_CAEEX|nr:hypothetical protein CEXT_742891 [Caerostris extrusa]
MLSSYSRKSSHKALYPNPRDGIERGSDIHLYKATNKAHIWPWYWAYHLLSYDMIHENHWTIVISRYPIKNVPLPSNLILYPDNILLCQSKALPLSLALIAYDP